MLMRKGLFIIIITICLSGGIVLAQVDLNYRAEKGMKEKITNSVDSVERFTNTMKQNIGSFWNAFDDMIKERGRETVEESKNKLAEVVEERRKSWVDKLWTTAKDKTIGVVQRWFQGVTGTLSERFNPLKIWIQQGSDKTREIYNNCINWIKNR